MAEHTTSPATSPVVKKLGQKKGMTFGEAVDKVTDGAKITRDEWEDPEIYGVLKNERLMIKGGVKGDGKFHPWIVGDGDLLSEDWRVI